MAITHYILRRATDINFTANVVDTNVGLDTSAMPTGLTPATTYYFKIKAVDASVSAPEIWSRTVRVSTPA